MSSILFRHYINKKSGSSNETIIIHFNSYQHPFKKFKPLGIMVIPPVLFHYNIVMTMPNWMPSIIPINTIFPWCSRGFSGPYKCAPMMLRGTSLSYDVRLIDAHGIFSIDNVFHSFPQFSIEGQRPLSLSHVMGWA